MTGELLDYLVQNEDSFRIARIPALYSDFRSQRTLNPDGYEANIAAWRRALANGALAGLAINPISSSSLLVLKSDQRLMHALESKKYGQPLALGAVFKEAVQDGGMLPLNEFLSKQDSIYTNPSAAWSSIPGRILGWGLRQVGIGSLAGDDEKLPDEAFVLIPNVEAAAKALESKLSNASSPFQRAFSKSHFQKTFASELVQDRTLSETDLEVLLKFLARDREILAYDGHTLRVKTSPSDEAQITPEDSAMASLKELMDDLSHQTDVLSSRVSQLDEQARDAVAKKNHVSALAALKSKKLAESQLEKRFGTLAQLQEVAAKLEQASDQVQLVSAMKSSASALKNLNAKVRGTKAVEQVVDDLREQMGEVDEVGNILSDVGPVVDEAEIDDELEALAKQEEKKHAEVEGKQAEAEQKAAAELANKLASANPPSTAPIKLQDGEDKETAEAVEGLKRMSLLEDGDGQRELAA